MSAVYLLFIYLGYSLVLRVADFITLARLQSLSLAPLSPPFSLPFILGEELAIGSFLALVLGISWRYSIFRTLWLGCTCVYLVFLAFEQLAYKTFLSRVDYILYASSHDILRLWSSIEGSFDVFFTVHILLALACSVLLFLRYRPQFVRTLAAAIARRPIFFALIGVIYIAVNSVLVLHFEQYDLNRSFPVVYASSYIHARAEQAEQERALDAAPETTPAARPLFGTEQDAGDLKSAKASLDAVSKQLNVVFYLMESASYRETSMSSTNPYDTTPFVKTLAKKSLVFANYYTTFAASTRSVFSALTGLFPYVDKAADVTKYSRLDLPNLVDTLHEEGYATGFFSSSDTLFDSLDVFLANLSYDIYVDKNLIPQNERRNVPAGAWGVDEEIVIDRALEWIEQVRDSGKPFYINYNAVYPHHPFRIPKQHRRLYEMDWGKENLKSRYRASLYYADMSIKRFFEGLKRLNVLEDTLFIITSDHGEAFGDLHSKNLIHAEYCYDEDSHIFLLLHNPGALGPPMQNARLGTHADLFPTILEILHIDRDLELDGQSLISDDYKEQMIFYCSRRHLGVKDGNFKFVTQKTGGKSELYDHSCDPEEQNDISRTNKDKVATYKKLVQDWNMSMLRAYRDRKQKAGLSDNEIQKLATQARGRLFAGARASMAGAAICLSSNRAACASARREPSFVNGSSLTVQVRIRKPGNVGLQIDLFNPSGVKILKQKTSHQNVKEMISANLSAEHFQAPGRYKARVLLLSSHAVHDSKPIFFYIEE